MRHCVACRGAVRSSGLGGCRWGLYCGWKIRKKLIAKRKSFCQTEKDGLRCCRLSPIAVGRMGISVGLTVSLGGMPKWKDFLLAG